MLWSVDMNRLSLSLLLSALAIFGQEAPRHILGLAPSLAPVNSALPEDIAMAHLRGLATELSLSPSDLESIYIAKQYRSSNNGVTHVIFRQRFQNAEVWNAEWVVNIDRDGRVLNAGGNLYPAPRQGAFLPVRGRAAAAARAAVAAVNPSLRDRFAPLESNQPARRSHGVRFFAGPLARDVEGAPVWYYSRGKLRPAWNFYVADSDRVHRYSVTVDDASRDILKQQTLTFFQSAAATTPPAPRGMVFNGESPQPNPTPGVRLTAPPPLVPRIPMSFQGDPIASPLGWMSSGGTSGNNVVAGENLTGPDFMSPTPSQGVNGDLTFPLQLGAGFYPLAFPDAAATNLFYWINRAHDLHYQYGFDEQAGNYQANNFGRGGMGGDPVFAYAHYGAQASVGQFENAFFALDGTDDDGVPAEVSMFVSGGLGPSGDIFTDGSYDALVMVHEYTHGVSSRLARQAYSVFQGGAMGEAWSDFYSLEYTLPSAAPPNGIYPVGEYFIQSWGTGIRTRPYSTDMTVDPLTFADIGHVTNRPEVHADGEIWVAALWEIRANLIAQFGDQEGRKRVRQLVIDGMKLAVPAATMVDMRDAILLADRVDYKGASQSQLWAGFAKRGLGALAFSQDGTTVHVSSSFELPSTTGQLKFYDSSIVIGEPVRVIVQDSNYTQPSMLIQLTGSSGDLENLILHQRGSVYVGSISTGLATVSRQNGRLELVTGDAVSIYYNDFDTASGSPKLMQATISAMLPYTVSATPAAFTFTGEQRYTTSGSSWLDYRLPFTFPFFDKKYGSVKVFANGLIAFDLPSTVSSCTDGVALMRYAAVTPLWTYASATSVTGSAQTGEGIYISTKPDSVTFRWASEFGALDDTRKPVNVAATLYNDGRIAFLYGSGNQSVDSPATGSQCGPTPVGISNGHDTYAPYYVSSNFQNQTVLHFDPPFNDSSLPTATITSPRAGDQVQDILKLAGTAADTSAVVTYVDVYIDDVLRVHTTPTGAPLTWASTLNIADLKPGDHTLKIRVTNARGGFSDVPSAPLTFTVNPGKAFPPVVTIEQPADNATVKGVFTVKGYAYDTGLRVSRVDTLIDGFVFAGTIYGAARTDITAGMNPQPLNGSGIGFTGSFSTVEGTPPIPDGVHTLQVRVVDQTGRFTLYPDTPLQITVKNGAAAPVTGVLEAPASNATLSGSVTVTGYMYSAGQKILGGYLLVDGQPYQTIASSLPRPDVCPSLPNADACPNIGFSVTLDTTKLLNGPHVLGIEGFNARGDYAIFPLTVKNGINVTVKN
jgi:hypothetical protein